MSEIPPVSIIGAGLAGCEAAWQLATRGVPVRLIDMKPRTRTPAHTMDGMAELVCSNSLRGAGLTSAVGLLKEELRLARSLLIQTADEAAVPAGWALAVDRRLFSTAVETKIRSHPLIAVEMDRCISSIPRGRVIVATGPLTEGGLADALVGVGAMLSYYDAIAPLVDASSIDMDPVFRADRYEPDTQDSAYLNCPMTDQQYFDFVAALTSAEKTVLRDFEKGTPFFEGCLPVEEIARRGSLTLAHGPLKPTGLIDPRTDKRPFAVVQLRPEDRHRTAYNLVGFQTRLTRPAQQRIFRTIPGLGAARFLRYGQAHRNSFVNAPKVLDKRLRLRSHPQVTLAGQLAGVEGYVESIACGWLAGFFVASECLNKGSATPPPPTTALGGLLRFLSIEKEKFEPSNVLWLMIEKPARRRGQSKRVHREASAKTALEMLNQWLSESCA
ncbi:MAG: methylenetetrahydrofolate--tRNA-(uracil(54)-C(5))-methyltransferase (FADH(2)-oxidizing) TrmFO [Myxococcota bacterium]|nr:methylenetetrahydrofolate--tRNA-(uracil(54)-C(5))-methyltransferase (FADH(2)-oxidizing) TrmFO [Myxococcota bacterium]